MRRLALVAALALVLMAAGSPMVGAEGSPDRAALKRMWSIADRLDCPVCQGQSVRESNAELALQMRDIILGKIAEGQSDEQIFAFFRQRYGESILRDPPKEGLALGVWLGPPIALIAGIAIVAGVLRRNRVRAAAPNDDLEPYEAIVDQLRRANPRPGPNP